MNAYFVDRYDFIPFGQEHYLIFSLFSLIAIGVTLYCYHHPNPQKHRKYLSLFLGVITILQLAKPFIRIHYGIFDIKDDLPFHLCNMLPLFLWLAVSFSSTFWFSIFFFWVIIGTTQSLITPTVTETFPHYESIRYWTVHFGLTFAAFFGWLILKWRPGPRQALFSFLGLNVLALVIYFINLALDSNYWYLMGKPKEATVLDSLWQWPAYLIQLEFISLTTFLTLALIIQKLTPKAGTKE